MTFKPPRCFAPHRFEGQCGPPGPPKSTKSKSISILLTNHLCWFGHLQLGWAGAGNRLYLEPGRPPNPNRKVAGEALHLSVWVWSPIGPVETQNINDFRLRPCPLVTGMFLSKETLPEEHRPKQGKEAGRDAKENNKKQRKTTEAPGPCPDLKGDLYQSP